MISFLGLLVQIINLFQFILIVYIISTWLINFNIINTSNRFVYTVMESMFRLCEPSLNFVRRYLPTFGSLDLSPIVVYLGLWFIKSLLIKLTIHYLDHNINTLIYRLKQHDADENLREELNEAMQKKNSLKKMARIEIEQG